MPGTSVYSLQQADTAAIAAAAFAESPSSLPETSYVCVGDKIDTDQQEGFLRLVLILQGGVSCACFCYTWVLAQGPWHKGA